MTRQVETGTWIGSPIRTARKAGRCDYWRGVQDDRDPALNGRCPEGIRAGADYFEGEIDPSKAGGFGRQRFCLAHA